MLPPFPSNLFENTAKSPDRKILLGMGDSYFARFLGMFKLMMVSFSVMKNPPILF